MTEFEILGLETVKFLRGKYQLDEIKDWDGKLPCLRFRDGKKTILMIYLHNNHYDFYFSFDKKARERFEKERTQFPESIQEIYDKAPLWRGGKRLLIRVFDFYTLEAVKKLIMIKKQPNRKPFSQENAVYSKCGHRCDLCVHFTEITEELRNKLIPHLNAVYGTSLWEMRCTGCDTSKCHCRGEGNELCEPLKCLQSKQLSTCFDCDIYPCKQTTVGYRKLEHRNLSFQDVTWAILPYVPYQYEK